MTGCLDKSPVGSSPFIPGFTLSDFHLGNGVSLRTAVGGSGAPLLLLHGHPQNHAVWRKIAPALAEHFTVIAPDLRGYGDSSKPDSDAQHRPYSKREMARDMSLLMAQMGYGRYAVAGHDRGGRVAHRLALDNPGAVTKVVFIDIAPTATMYARTDKTFATRYFWWFFLIQPAPLPEKLIAADPAFFLKNHIDGQLKTPGATEPAVFDDYLRCYDNPQTLHAVCEDYRAAATIDLEDDEADRDARITAPVLALWGAKGTVGELYDVVQTWREKALSVQGTALPCGHSPQEEVPEQTLEELLRFLL